MSTKFLKGVKEHLILVESRVFVVSGQIHRVDENNTPGGNRQSNGYGRVKILNLLDCVHLYVSNESHYNY